MELLALYALIDINGMELNALKFLVLLLIVVPASLILIYVMLAETTKSWTLNQIPVLIIAEAEDITIMEFAMTALKIAKLAKMM